MPREAVLSAAAYALVAPRDEQGWFVDPDGVEAAVEGLLSEAFQMDVTLTEAKILTDKRGYRYCLDDHGRRTGCSREATQTVDQPKADSSSPNTSTATPEGILAKVNGVAAVDIGKFKTELGLNSTPENDAVIKQIASAALEAARKEKQANGGER